MKKSYDVYIPINKTVGTVKSLIEKGLSELTDNIYTPTKETNFYSKDTGIIYDINQTVRNTDLQNGSKIILI